MTQLHVIICSSVVACTFLDQKDPGSNPARAGKESFLLSISRIFSLEPFFGILWFHRQKYRLFKTKKMPKNSDLAGARTWDLRFEKEM